MFHGKGKYIFGKKSDYFGNRYEGEFKKGLFDGYGKYLTNDGDVYKGQFKKISIMVLENIILKMVNYTKVIGNMGNTMA